MVRDPFAPEATPELQDVLDALDDPACRKIITEADGEEPMTAKEIAEHTGLPLSTTYRKLDLLSEASILDESTEIREGGHHRTRYRLDFEAVHIGIDDDREFEVTISRPARTADEQLARLWTEVRKET